MDCLIDIPVISRWGIKLKRNENYFFENHKKESMVYIPCNNNSMCFNS